MRIFRFYIEENKWYVDLPEWTGEKSNLEMVMGADTFLNILSQGESEVYVRISTEPFLGCETLHFIKEDGSGGWYKLNTYMGLFYDMEMWLCDVTTFIFGSLPEKIYFK